MTHDVAAREFEAHRRFVWGLAYRITGSAADADDVVQETFVRALERPPEVRADGWRGWLARVAANLSVDALRRRRRQGYKGPWLPAPIETGDAATAPGYEIVSPELTTEHRYDLMESVSMAFMLALEHLTPRQRAVLILRDVFDYTVAEAASALDMTQANVKVTHHRARAAMAGYDARRVLPTRAHQSMAATRLTEFLTYLQNNDVASVEAMLAADVRFVSDSNGEFPAAMNVVTGRDGVRRLLFGLKDRQAIVRSEFVTLNGEPALVAETDPRGGWAPRFVLRVDLTPDGRVCEIHAIVATAKLAAVRTLPSEETARA